MKNLSGKPAIIVFTVLIIALLFLVFRPIPVSRDNSIVINTTIDKVSQGSEDNIILKLNNASGIFYINHGLQKGLDLDTLQKELQNREVSVLYLKSNFFSGFSPVKGTKYITELKLGDKVIYSEL
ncbi:MAG: hypothetical protein B7X86_14490 [Sphingobacteriales bacterium 17-39-43]|uniref:hypothetical protein n=1 Tax=Daejeonella sp. TaxID=2805397 RepID=UPI000BD31C9B|nr:hypothetical protein [Daejeonella sp.]OYZ30156.1 MAG: hypothetical protein B7Y24_14255 [Sphingobacteriales bacterium 16-39-50]OZA22874.1 MAG: hypothetical protein B7X86_14490 [Sphingobacteriales bacterium 17-39-43]OZA60185.1 MAG: hypothetical protein B7X75_03655 [Sphingobacteriales bacterium 39-40-5]HQS51223.1 hypothetical protein [Daejeonella sp.]HQT23975.1 hypothetical protein [Daejeonella sp.]